MAVPCGGCSASPDQQACACTSHHDSNGMSAPAPPLHRWGWYFSMDLGGIRKDGGSDVVNVGVISGEALGTRAGPHDCQCHHRLQPSCRATTLHFCFWLAQLSLLSVKPVVAHDLAGCSLVFADAVCLLITCNSPAGPSPHAHCFAIYTLLRSCWQLHPLQGHTHWPAGAPGV